MSTVSPSPAAKATPASNTGLFYLAVASSVVVCAVCLTIYLLVEGSRGDTVIAPLALLVAIVDLVGTIVIWLLDTGRIRFEIPRWFRAGIRWSVIFVISGTLAIAAWLLHKVVKTPDIPVTEALRTTGEVGMKDGSEAVISIPDPSRRTQLSLILKLRNNDPTGNCVGSATLDSRLLVDGVVRQSVKNVRPLSEIRFPLGEPAQTASVAITVHMRDYECRVNLSIHEAVLFSDRR